MKRFAPIYISYHIYTDVSFRNRVIDDIKSRYGIDNVSYPNRNGGCDPYASSKCRALIIIPPTNLSRINLSSFCIVTRKEIKKAIDNGIPIFLIHRPTPNSFSSYEIYSTTVTTNIHGISLEYDSTLRSMLTLDNIVYTYNHLADSDDNEEEKDVYFDTQVAYAKLEDELNFDPWWG